MMTRANGRTDGMIGRSLIAIATLVAVMAAGPSAVAQDYPTRAVRIIVPFPAGGPASGVVGWWGARKGGAGVIEEKPPGAGGKSGAPAAPRGGRGLNPRPL